MAVGSFSHIFGVIDALNGNEIYKNVFNDTIESACCFHPKKPIVFVGCFDGNVYCINFKNFVIEWEYSTNDRIKSKPAVCLEGNAIVFGSYDKHIYCLLIEVSTYYIIRFQILSFYMNAFMTNSCFC